MTSPFARYAPAARAARIALLCAVFGIWPLACRAQAPSSASQAETGRLRLVAGEQALIAVPALRRVAIGDPAVADVTPVRGGVSVLGKRPGATYLALSDSSQATERLLIEVRAAPADLALAGTGAQLHVRGDTAILDGSLRDVPALAAARVVAADSAPKLIDRSHIDVPGVVQVDVKIVEFSKTLLKQAGFNLFSQRANGFGFGVFGPNSLGAYQPGTQGNGSTGSVNFSGSGSVSTPMSAAFNLVVGPFGRGLFGNLSVLETSGLARVLAQPTLVALSGQSASFLAGGELPIPESGGLGTTTVSYKPFGVGLTLTPTVLGAQRIALKVAPEASDLDYTRALVLNGVAVPAITTRRADTTVELGDGESFVIGGLVSRSTTSSVDKVPLLGDLPVIGAFFKRLNYSQDERELVIVVTPHLVRPIARGTALVLPGESLDRPGQTVWGDYLGGAAAPAELPGFSR